MKTLFSLHQKAKLSNESLMVGVDIARKTNKGYCRTSDGHKAQIVISRKLLRLIYALVRDNRDYIHSYSDPSTPLRTGLREAA